MNHDRGSSLTLASRWRHLVATVIDAILVPALTLVLIMLTNVLEDAEDYADSWWILQVPVSYTHLTLPTNREV